MAKQTGGKAPLTGPILASEPPRQASAIDHDVYTGAHAVYSKMTATELQAHRRALNDVRDGKAPATKQQLTGDYGY
jgi:hypothetical protein